MSRQEPVDEVVFVKVNDETKWFSVAESIEENNAFDATSSDQSAAGLSTSGGGGGGSDDANYGVDDREKETKAENVSDMEIKSLWGQTMGFSMEGSIKDMERFIDLKGADDVVR
nr:hypothetical protein [Tanacetum cinerariifolium]